MIKRKNIEVVLVDMCACNNVSINPLQTHIDQIFELKNVTITGIKVYNNNKPSFDYRQLRLHRIA